MEHRFILFTRNPRSCRLWAPGAAMVVLVVAWLSATARAAAPTTTPSIDFDRDVQQILSDNCYFCHGPDAGRRKGKLRLDVLDPKLGPFAAREQQVIVPGKPEQSELMRRLTADEDDRMPPPKSNRRVKPEQIETLRRWIEQGAKWGQHWAFVPPARGEFPEVKDTAWSRNAIDRFILSRLEKENLTPSPEAPRHTLIRRVSLDLTGLPPTPEEVDAFVADTSPDAYEKVVDRLLASPRYGERMVWEWLDASRYADTNGYQGDPTRTMWPWRDWVIKAMNDNMPFDQFVSWQLSGDLIPNATQEQRLASAFNRNHPYNGEGGRIPEETRVENVFDRVDTTTTAFLGLTVACARCHDHKFDQISQKEYYQLFAYFNQSSETGELKYAGGGNAFPVMNFTTDTERQKLAQLQADAKQAADRMVGDALEIETRQAEWERSVRGDQGWTELAPVSATSTGGATMITQPDGSVLVSGTNPDQDIHEIALRTDLDAVTAIRVEVLPDPSLSRGGPGRSSDSGNFALTNIEASAASIADPSRTHKVTFSSADATYSQGGFDVAGAIDGDSKSAWAVLKAGELTPVSGIFRFAEPAGFAGGTDLRLKFHYGSQHKQHAMGRFRISLTGGSALTPDVASAVVVPVEQRTDAQKNLVRDFYRTRVDKELKALNDAASAARKAVEDFERGLPKIMVMDDAQPRETHILAKGAYDKPADKVEPGVLAVLNPPPKDLPNNRLALAKWIVDPANPLTARVIVNRYWQQFFGTGIVKTAEDFGVQGERPVHPQLLDWLAVEFMESGWDVKAMHRLLVTSSTYKQRSSVTPEQFESDPENRLLARGARFRLPSVTIRDQALAVSGLLVEKVGGPPVKVYQPPGVWEEATFGQIKYEQDHGDALYRRGVYVFWRRIVGPTEFFDAGSRSVCSVRPSRTNTPLHALTTLNDTTFVEAARSLAQRVMSTADTDADRIERACRLVLSRGPKPKEQEVIIAALERLKSQYAADPESAAKLLAVGESKRDEKLDAAEHAAYTGLCLAILNMDEALTKE